MMIVEKATETEETDPLTPPRRSQLGVGGLDEFQLGSTVYKDLPVCRCFAVVSLRFPRNYETHKNVTAEWLVLAGDVEVISQACSMLHDVSESSSSLRKQRHPKCMFSPAHHFCLRSGGLALHMPRRTSFRLAPPNASKKTIGKTLQERAE